MIWLLEKNIFENIDNLKMAIYDNKDTCVVAQYGLLTLNFEKSIDETQKIFAYGSLGFGAAIKRQYGHLKNFHIYCNLQEFKCSYYYPLFNKYLLQQNALFIPYGQLIYKKDLLLKYFGNSDAVFIRPNSGFKDFTGKVIYAESWEKDIEELGFYNVYPETFCVVAEPQNILKEWRLIVQPNLFDSLSPSNQTILTGCQYKENNKLIDKAELPSNIKRFAIEVLKDVKFSPDPFWVLDIAETKDGLSVIEVNSMSCSGYYTCDLNKIAEAISLHIG